jgi:hypothetical protein
MESHNKVEIRFGRVMGIPELEARFSELTDEQFQAVIQVIQMNVEEIGSIIDQPKADAWELKHLSGGLFWSRSLLEKVTNLRKSGFQRDPDNVVVPFAEV